MFQLAGAVQVTLKSSCVGLRANAIKLERSHTEIAALVAPNLNFNCLFGLGHAEEFYEPKRFSDGDDENDLSV